MKYPFEFNELLLTESLIRYLGFENWWGDSGDGFEIGYGPDGNSTAIIKYRLRATCEESEPYSYSAPVYQTAHIMTENFETLYFFHELYEDVCKRCSREDRNLLLHRWNKSSVYSYLKSYLEYKQKNQQYADKKEIQENGSQAGSSQTES